MSRVETFNAHRPLLLSIAYRMLGSRSDAEDAVQETFLRWQGADDAAVASPRSYLATIITRLCIDQLKSARAQREVYVGPWLPEPVETAHGADAVSSVELAESLTMAFLVLLESLTPMERAAYLMREVFDYDYAEIAHTLRKSEVSCRQMIHRARERVASRNRRFDPSREETERVTARFLEAAGNGDVAALMNLFTEDAVLLSDGGGKARAAVNPIRGAEDIARFITGVVRKNLTGATHSLTEINSQPAFITTVDGQPISVTVLDIRGGLVHNVFVVVNPDKLRHFS